MLRSLLEAKVVIADLTGKNPNVYYELAVAHSFSKPVVCMVDKVDAIAFDTKDERIISIGEYTSALTVPQAEEAKKQLRAALGVVLAEDYIAPSPVAEVAKARSIDQLAPTNPVASELSAMRDLLEEIRALSFRSSRSASLPAGYVAERDAMRYIIEEIAANRRPVLEVLSSVDLQRTTSSFDGWLEKIVRTAAETGDRVELVRPQRSVRPAPTEVDLSWTDQPRPMKGEPPF
jgi:hypothetical protein